MGRHIERERGGEREIFGNREIGRKRGRE